MPSVAYTVLLDHLDTGVLVVDSQRRISDFNPAAIRLLGTRGGSLIGRSLLEATLSYEIMTLLAAAMAGGLEQVSEVRRNDLSGRVLRVRVFPLPPPNSSSDASEYLVLLDDVTELRRLETVRRDFVANVSHELRTPLASIRAMAETLQDGALEDVTVAGRFISIIVGEVERLTRILEDLLILSRSESQQAERAEFVLSDLIHDVVERFQQQADRAGVQLQHTITERFTVVANRDQMEQVMVNLVDNAVKYTPSSGKVSVTAEVSEGRVRILITDTGIGIMSQDLPRLFERFYRVDKARSRQSGGTGLGLSIVKHIIESHGGSVAVESEYNRGSTFSFFLPI